MRTTDDDRNESPLQRDDRNLMELLQELRVAGLGVQVLFGFLLSLPFTTRFIRLSPSQRGLYVADLLLAALVAVGLAVTVAVILVVSFVDGGASAVVVGIFLASLFTALWFVIPLARREEAEESRASRGHTMHQ
jgi:hypothetical protein